MTTKVEIVPHDGETIAGMYRDRARRARDGIRGDAGRYMSPQQKAGFLMNASSDFSSAARWFENAAAASIGHNRRDRYRTAAEACREDSEKCLESARCIQRDK